jgi:hypothetical protein
LKSVTLPASITAIRYEGFYNCISLTDFNFEGTVKQWCNISKESYWGDDSPFTEIKCSNGTVLKKPITFTVGGTTYYTNTEITWSEWLSTEFNFDGEFRSDVGCIIKGDEDSYYVTLSDGTKVLETDTIIANTAYNLQSTLGS